jgi:hypothetical protein
MTWKKSSTDLPWIIEIQRYITSILPILPVVGRSYDFSSGNWIESAILSVAYIS